MLKQALQSLAHGLEHLLANTEADRAFAFVHVDQAIELLLKEKVRQLKESIYAGSDRTIGIFDAKRILDRRKVAVPDWSSVEIVHQQRNLIQHQGLVPDPDTATIYLQDVLPFFERFLRDEFHVDFRKVLGTRYVPSILASQEEKLLAVAEENSQKEPRLAIMSAATAVELVIRPLMGASGGRSQQISSAVRQLAGSGILDRNEVSGFDSLWRIRNKAVHLTEDPTKSEARFAIETAKMLVERLRGHERRVD